MNTCRRRRVSAQKPYHCLNEQKGRKTACQREEDGGYCKYLRRRRGSAESKGGKRVEENGNVCGRSA